MRYALLLLFLSSLAQAAPAPFARPAKRQPVRLPQVCVMHFVGVPYLAQFRPGGNYEALHQESGGHWVGTWSLECDREGQVWLTVEEAMKPHGHAIHWRYQLKPCLRESVSEGSLRLCPP